MIYSVDRIENGIALCVDENGESVKISADGLHEGDVVEITDGVVEVNKKLTEEKKEEMFDLQADLFSRKSKK